jgi:hypothetical protein
MTLTPTRPPKARTSRVSPIYLGGLAAALLALVGTLAIRALDGPSSDPPSPNAATSSVAQTKVEDALPTEAPRRDEDRPSVEPVLASAPEAGETKPDARANKTRRRKARTRTDPAPTETPTILDPWK